MKGAEWDGDSNVEHLGAGEKSNSRKCKRNVWLSASRKREPK